MDVAPPHPKPAACPKFPVPSPPHLRPASLDSVKLTMDRTSWEPLNLRAGVWESVNLLGALEPARKGV